MGRRILEYLLGVREILRLTNDTDVALRVEHQAQSVADYSVVVRDDNFDRLESGVRRARHVGQL